MASISKKQKPDVEYVEIVDWDRHITNELRYKCKPPWRWCKLFTTDLDTHNNLTLREYGAYIRLLHLATQTDNCIEFRPGWIRRRSGVTRNVIESLSSRDLVRIVSRPKKAEKNQQNQTSYSEISGEILENEQNLSSTKEEEEEEEENRDLNLDLNPPATSSRNSDTAPAEKDSRTAPEDNNFNFPCPTPTPTSARRTGQFQQANSLLAEKGNWKDSRTWEELTDSARPIVLKHGITDPTQLHILAGQSLRIKPKQCAVVIDRLRKEGTI